MPAAGEDSTRRVGCELGLVEGKSCVCTDSGKGWGALRKLTAL